MARPRKPGARSPKGATRWRSFNLGLLHETGRGVPEDPAQAAAWYERAALQGVTQAQFNLALLHQTGRGVEKDGAQALYWLEVAARHGAGAEQERAADAAARLAEIPACGGRGQRPRPCRRIRAAPGGSLGPG